MSDNMFHYADVPLSVIDNLINLEEELQVLERVQKFKLEIDPNWCGYKKIADSGLPIDEMSDSLQGHTNLEIFTEDENANAGKLFNEILKPIIGYEPNTQGNGSSYIYEEYTIRELKDTLTDMRLPTSGNKSKLIERIISHKNKM
jgi:hypothetical protein